MDYCSFKAHEWNRLFYNLNISFSLEVSFTCTIKSWQLLPTPAFAIISQCVCLTSKRPHGCAGTEKPCYRGCFALQSLGALPPAEIKVGRSGCALIPLLSYSTAAHVVQQLFGGVHLSVSGVQLYRWSGCKVTCSWKLPVLEPRMGTHAWHSSVCKWVGGPAWSSWCPIKKSSWRSLPAYKWITDFLSWQPKQRDLFGFMCFWRVSAPCLCLHIWNKGREEEEKKWTKNFCWRKTSIGPDKW